VVREMMLEPLRATLRDMCLRVIAQGEGKVSLPQAGRLKMGVVDGTCFGPLYASAFSQPGEVDMPLDLEPIEKQGKELAASTRLLKRLVQRYGMGFVDLLVGDGLYAYREFFRFCRQSLGCDGVVKTDEKRLDVIQDAEGLFQAYPGLKDGIDYAEGVDEARGKGYQVWAASHFEWAGLEYPLRIAKVVEVVLKGKKKGQEETFYVLTTHAGLSARDLREVAHLRWHVENNTFKALNEQCHTKHGYVRDAKGMQGVLLILFVAFILIQAYRLWVESVKEKIKLASRWERVTFCHLRQWLWISLGSVMPEGDG
jgi:hypothetical protein